MCTSSFENIKINAKIVHLNLFIFYFQSNALSLLTILYWYINQTQPHYIRSVFFKFRSCLFLRFKNTFEKYFLFQINIF